MDFRLALSHPRLFARKAFGKARRTLVRRAPGETRILDLGGGIRFEYGPFEFLSEDDRLLIYTGSYDLVLDECMRRHLGAGSIFIDAGANVGYVSARAARYCGTTGEVHSFEPLPECFARLEALRKLNPRYPFFFNNFALGETESTLSISYDPGGKAHNATLVPGEHGSIRRDVPVKRLDDYILGQVSEPRRIGLIKIDVEGYEFPLLRGLKRFFLETPHRPPIVCEIKPWELENLAYRMEDFQAFMAGFSYLAYDMLNPGKVIDLVALKDMEVVLFRSSQPDGQGLG